MYGANGVSFDHGTKSELELITKHGYGGLPVCIAKNAVVALGQSQAPGLPKNFRITVNEIRVSAGAGFVVAICGNIVTMPAFPRSRAARIKILATGSGGSHLQL